MQVKYSEICHKLYLSKNNPLYVSTYLEITSTDTDVQIYCISHEYRQVTFGQLGGSAGQHNL